MAPKISKKAICFSVIFHAAIIGLAVWGAIAFHAVKFGGGGSGVVSVWISDGSGTVIDGDKPAARIKSKTEMEVRRKGKNVKEDEKSLSGKTGAPSGGPGIGDGSGAGIGSGKDGDPALATIWKKINGAKYYPQVAKQRRVEGLPRVTFSVNVDGSVSGLKLAASCGDKVLDDAAVETVRRAAPLPFYPAPITVTVKYMLK